MAYIASLAKKGSAKIKNFPPKEIISFLLKVVQDKIFPNFWFFEKQNNGLYIVSSTTCLRIQI